jgi:hypothetical protein
LKIVDSSIDSYYILIIGLCFFMTATWNFFISPLFTEMVFNECALLFPFATTSNHIMHISDRRHMFRFRLL